MRHLPPPSPLVPPVFFSPSFFLNPPPPPLSSSSSPSLSPSAPFLPPPFHPHFPPFPLPLPLQPPRFVLSHSGTLPLRASSLLLPSPPSLPLSPSLLLRLSSLTTPPPRLPPFNPSPTALPFSFSLRPPLLPLPPSSVGHSRPLPAPPIVGQMERVIAMHPKELGSAGCGNRSSPVLARRLGKKAGDFRRPNVGRAYKGPAVGERLSATAPGLDPRQTENIGQRHCVPGGRPRWSLGGRRREGDE